MYETTMKARRKNTAPMRIGPGARLPPAVPAAKISVGRMMITAIAKTSTTTDRRAAMSRGSARPTADPTPVARPARMSSAANVIARPIRIEIGNVRSVIPQGESPGTARFVKPATMAELIAVGRLNSRNSGQRRR